MLPGLRGNLLNAKIGSNRAFKPDINNSLAFQKRNNFFFPPQLAIAKGKTFTLTFAAPHETFLKEEKVEVLTVPGAVCLNYTEMIWFN